MITILKADCFYRWIGYDVTGEKRRDLKNINGLSVQRGFMSKVTHPAAQRLCELASLSILCVSFSAEMRPPHHHRCPSECTLTRDRSASPSRGCHGKRAVILL